MVEPTRAKPEEHEKIFSAAITCLLGQPNYVTGGSYVEPTRAEAWDLVVFPEAFLTENSFLKTLEDMNGSTAQGYIHVGLRPGSEIEPHLFSRDASVDMCKKIKLLNGVKGEDLKAFEEWLAQVPTNAKLNIACLFGIDASGSVRVCLHPKMVKAAVEIGITADADLHEGNLLTFVTLCPTDKRFSTLSIQPLICSDAVDLNTAVIDRKPILGMTAGANIFSHPPDHIDIVSVVVCTPQPEHGKEPGTSLWYRGFRDMFREPSEKDTCLPRDHALVYYLC